MVSTQDLSFLDRDVHDTKKPKGRCWARVTEQLDDQFFHVLAGSWAQAVIEPGLCTARVNLTVQRALKVK